MDEPLEIVVTNDDGIDSPGLHAVAETLSSFGDVTVVAPADDQSAVGRAMSHSAALSEHDRGYVVEGTPVDCVVAALGELVPDADLVVSGCNRGANLGVYGMGRSGTVGGAIEAAFFGVPAIAVSLFIPTNEGYKRRNVTREDYSTATDALTHLVDSIDRSVFDSVDYLNLNTPIAAVSPTRMRLTKPSTTYDMDAELDGDTVAIRDRIWDRMANDALDEAVGTDRRTVIDGDISLSALSVHHEVVAPPELNTLVEGYNGPQSATND